MNRLKLTVIGLFVADGTRSESAIAHHTFVTRFPIGPEGAPALAASLFVDTVIPHCEPEVAPPIVAPARVTVYGPEEMLAPLAKVKTMLVAPGGPAVALDGIAVGVGDAAIKA